MYNITTLLKDILAPKKCYGCQKQGHFLCPQCEKGILRQQSVCYHCKQNTHKFSTHKQCLEYIQLDQVILHAHYRDKIISKLIKNGKFYNKKDVWEEISQYYTKALQQNLGSDGDKYILIPVPMYFWKKAFRGYNQSQLLVKYISKQTGIRLEYNLLKKIKKTQQQSHLSKQQRVKNLSGSLVLNKKLVEVYKDKTIIIIDDVVSTGSTFNSISMLLKKAGIKNTIGCAFASD